MLNPETVLKHKQKKLCPCLENPRDYDAEQFALAMIVGVLFIAVLFMAHPAKAEEIPQEVYCVIGEAESEGYGGMLAVSEAIRNRKALMGDKYLQGVYGCRSPRVIGKKYSLEVLETALQAWTDSELDGDITHGAQFWEGKSFKKPYWAKKMTMTLDFENQRFYRKD